MPTTKVTPPHSDVNLSDGITVKCSEGHGLQVFVAGQLQTALDLTDAIKVAKLVMAQAEWAGVDVIGNDGEPATDLGTAIDWAEYDYGPSVEDDYDFIRSGC